jgi:hemerythrin-like domain-containing protein
MDEHLALLDLAADVRGALGRGERAEAVDLLHRLGGLLDRHVRREEDGVFTALADAGEYLDEIGDLEKEHQDFDARIARLDPDRPGFADDLSALFGDLSDHIDREDLGIFPVSVVTLGAHGWDTIAHVHAAQPSFLAGA